MTQKRIPWVAWLALAAALLLGGLIAAAAFGTAKPDPTSIIISQSTEGEAWPFTFTEGRLECIHPASVIITDTATNTTYSINGAADAQAASAGWADVRPVWRDTGISYAPKVDISSVIDKGLALCK